MHTSSIIRSAENGPPIGCTARHGAGCLALGLNRYMIIPIRHWSKGVTAFMRPTITRTSVQNGIVLLTIDRPQRRNALDIEAYAQLTAILQQLASDATASVIVLQGAGGHFTAGNDLADFAALATADTVPGINFLRTLSTFSKPLIAAVEGNAIGIGTTLLLHCDLAYAASDARLQLPFVNLGLTPEGAATYLLPLLAGCKKAAQLLLLGEPFSAQQAEQFGLINEVVEPGQALARAMACARQLAELSPEAVANTRQLMRAGQAHAIQEALNNEERVFLERCRAPETQMKFAAFSARAQ